MSKYRSQEETKDNICPIVIRDGSCHNCPHVIKNDKKREDHIPICYIGEE